MTDQLPDAIWDIQDTDKSKWYLSPGITFVHKKYSTLCFLLLQKSLDKENI